MSYVWIKGRWVAYPFQNNISALDTEDQVRRQGQELCAWDFAHGTQHCHLVLPTNLRASISHNQCLPLAMWSEV